MVEDHRSQTDLSSATVVVLSLHSSKHTQLAARRVWAFPVGGGTLWRRIPPSRWSCSCLSQSLKSTQTSNTSKVRQKFLLLELLRVSQSWCRRFYFQRFQTFRGLTESREKYLKISGWIIIFTLEGVVLLFCCIYSPSHFSNHEE